MLRRLVIVFMLMLFPLQWSAAQGHELADDAAAFVQASSAAPGTGAEVSRLLTHTGEPGGVCQFHELSQPSAATARDHAADLPARAGEGWRPAGNTAATGSGPPGRIDRPRWNRRPGPAAIS